jgi:hypothetical protein
VSSSSTGVGVSGLASSSVGLTSGVWGSCASAAGVGVRADNTDGGLALQARGNTRLEGTLDVGPPASLSFTVDPTNPGNGETAILVRRNVGGILSQQRVSVGPPNSGGAGFRVLRVAN